MFQKLGGIFTALAGCLAVLFGGWLVDLSYDLSYLLRLESTMPQEAVLVLMDTRSYSDFAQDPNAPWSRGLHAELLNRLTACGPKAVVFDSYFTEPGVSPGEVDADRRLVDAARRNGSVFVAADVSRVSDHATSANGTQVIPPFPGLREVVRGYSPLRSRGKTARRSFLEFDHPSLPQQIASLVSTNGTTRVKRREWLEHYGPPGHLPWRTYGQVLRNEVPPEFFAGRLVFVGPDHRDMAGVSRPDLWLTPYTRLEGLPEAPGVEIVATACLNLLRDEGLERLAPAIELGILGLAGMAGVGVLARLRMPAAILSAFITAGAVMFVGVTLVWWTKVWFPWLAIGAVQIPFALAWIGMGRIRTVWISGDSTAQAMAADSNASSEARTKSRPQVPVPAASANDLVAVHDVPVRSIGRSSPGKPEPPKPGDSGADARPSAVPDPLAAPSSQLPPHIPDFELIRRIGRGGCGEVWLGRDAVGRFRAVKIVRRDQWMGERPYLNEFEGIRNYAPISMAHATLLPILHVGPREPEAFFYYVMELADDVREGSKMDPDRYAPRSLASDLAQGQIPLVSCLAVAEHLAEALEILHQHHLLHRDIKPANVIFVRGSCRLADLGLVTSMDADHSGKTYVGTPGYIAPEGPKSPSADLFSLGKLMYTAAMGLPAGSFPDLPDWLPLAPDRRSYWQLNAIILKCCELNPKDRYTTASELRKDLAELRMKVEKGGEE